MWKRYKNSTDGNVALMFGGVVLMITMGVGLATDGSRLMAVKARALAVSDAAALSGAAATEAQASDREEIVRANIEANLYAIAPGELSGEPIITFDDEAETVEVTLPVSLNMPFGGLFGKNSRPLVSSSKASYLVNTIDPVTIAFALDVSGSMEDLTADGRPKIEVVQSATTALFDAIESGVNDPNRLQGVIRTGMSAYNTDLVTTQPIAPGWDHLEASLSALIADGGTDSTPALQNSYDQVLNDRSWRFANEMHYDPARLKEYIIFMTDGDNNEPEFDQASIELCQEIRDDGIDLYSVAFDAPDTGQLLLIECATPNDRAAERGRNRADSGACLTAGRNGLALGRCADRATRSEYFYDASDAAAFEAAFERIGSEISRSNVRLN